MTKRCFIVDPVCAITYGHSLNSLKYFRTLAEKFFEETQVYASKHLPEIDNFPELERFFNFYYEDYIEIERAVDSQSELSADIFASMDDLSSYDFYEFFQQLKISSDDTIMMPSADVHSLNGLLTTLSRVQNSKKPRLLIRLINVMENMHFSGTNKLPDCLQRLFTYNALGFNVKIAAETPKYARYLQDLSGLTIHTAPYPSFETRVLPLPVGKNFTILCGGSGRADKGFFRLCEIIEATNRAKADVNFIVQNLPDKLQLENIRYLNRLYSLPNVKLLPGVLSYDEIIDSYAQSHVTLMPYDPATYEYRGSAMLMESLLLGRQCIGQSGTGFAEQIDQYDAGMTCASNSEIAYAINALSHTSNNDLIDRATRAREVYIADVGLRYENWIRG